MPPNYDIDRIRTTIQAITLAFGVQGASGAITMLECLGVPLEPFQNIPVPTASNGFRETTEWNEGLKLLRDDPSKWFKTTQVDERDLALINASPLPWVNLGPPSFLKHVFHKLKDQPFKTTLWTVDNDKNLRGMIDEVGAGFSGFPEPLVHPPPRNWESMMINVSISGNIAPGVTWGLLSGRPTKTRVLAGPSSTCPQHPWDIMILRDFHTNTTSLDRITAISSRQYDVLLMKMCEDIDYPWVVLAVKDSGPLEMPASCCSSDGHCDNSCLGF